MMNASTISAWKPFLIKTIILQINKLILPGDKFETSWQNEMIKSKYSVDKCAGETIDHLL